MRSVLPPIGAGALTLQPAAAQARDVLTVGSPLVGVTVSVAPVIAEFGVATAIATCSVGPSMAAGNKGSLPQLGRVIKGRGPRISARLPGYGTIRFD